jgi:hypothetical protein
MYVPRMPMNEREVKRHPLLLLYKTPFALYLYMKDILTHQDANIIQTYISNVGIVL